MKVTLYEVLEVSENASKEVIEKAYKVLAKKYHPDLQTLENKQMAEQKMKQINEAYDILSDDTKRREYDEKLDRQREIEEQEKASRQSNIDYSNGQANTRYADYTTYNHANASYSNSQSQAQTNQDNSYNGQEMSKEEQKYREAQRRKYEEQLRRQQEQMRQNMQAQYENAYYNYLRSLGYRIKERWTWEKTKKLILALLIMTGIIFILWLFPPTRQLMVNIYQGNALIKVLVDIFVGVFKAFFQAIGTGFKSLFNGW